MMEAVPNLATLLVVDDDASLRAALADYLGRQGFEVLAAANGHEMNAHLARGTVELVILDVMMPGEDGLAICRRLAGNPPVLMLSAAAQTIDRVVGLELGAADYLAKPFDPRELVGRVRAILRRGSEPGSPRPIHFSGWRLDEMQHTLHDPEGRLVHLTSGEWALLGLFLKRPERLFSRATLMDLLHGNQPGPFDRAIDLTVSRLRRKLGRAGNQIETVRGEGYRFKASGS